MHTISLAAAQHDFAALVARVLDDREPAVVSTPSGDCVVVVSLDDYSAWQETNYLLSNPANAAHLRRSLTEGEAGKMI